MKRNRIGYRCCIPLVLFVLFSSIPFFVTAAETPVPHLYRYTLDNGLDVFVAENHSVPLVTIEIAVKCGAFTQTPQTAGLFHLYEHMMFKGNALYKNAAAVTRALSQMGVAEWNGSTGVECVNYYFTVPSSCLEEGLRFWNAAVREPLLDKKELENEKNVVLSEIRGNFSNPARILSAAKCKALFSDAPWKLDSGGSETVVEEATVSQLKKIQKTYYIPNNSAVFVGGDVQPDEVYALVKQIFGSWKRGKNPFAGGIARHSRSPFEKPALFVMPYERLSPQLAQVEVIWRGPDAEFDRDDTYAADVFSEQLSNPDGIFVSSFVHDGYIGIPDADYVWGGYPTSRQCGLFSVGAMLTSPEEELAARAVYFMEKLPAVFADAARIEQSAVDNTVRSITDANIYANETASGMLGTLRFWWICADEEYYYSYTDRISRVTSDALSDFVETYFTAKNPLLTVLVNPDVYETIKEQFMEKGFAEVSADNAFWFKEAVLP